MCICAICGLSIHLLMNTYVAFTFWLLWIILPWTWVYTYLFKSLLPCLLSIYPEVKLMDHIWLFCVYFFLKSFFHISTEAVPLYITAGSAEGFWFLHILASTNCFLFWFVFFFWSWPSWWAVGGNSLWLHFPNRSWFLWHPEMNPKQL